jgi:hypothetical protein
MLQAKPISNLCVRAVWNWHAYSNRLAVSSIIVIGMRPTVRVMLDQIFGENNFQTEIRARELLLGRTSELPAGIAGVASLAAQHGPG